MALISLVPNISNNTDVIQGIVSEKVDMGNARTFTNPEGLPIPGSSQAFGRTIPNFTPNRFGSDLTPNQQLEIIKQRQKLQKQQFGKLESPKNSTKSRQKASDSIAELFKTNQTSHVDISGFNANPADGPMQFPAGKVPIVPFTSQNTKSTNGSLVQLPILWTALSVALGVEVKGEIIRGLPCIKRFNQLFCPTAGNRYPTDKIEKFIDDNKALIRRMYGEFQTPAPDDSSKRTSRKKREDEFPDFTTDEEVEIDHDYMTLTSFLKGRSKRQTSKTPSKVDTCESSVEVVTPFWAANSSGKIRAIVNTQHFEQAIHQELCQKASTKRCTGECTCEQKYKWHRLLSYDPDNDCKGIFMDWFLFPSCCVCRCSGSP